MHGTPTRPALPIEIVRDMSRLSHLTVPMEEVNTATRITAHAYNQQVVRRLWFETRPLDSLRLINTLATLQLFTYCEHQGWVSMPNHGSWSWFELAILTNAASIQALKSEAHPQSHESSGLGRIKSREDGSPLRWVSHNIPVPQKKPAHLDGPLFNADHELFSCLEVGDPIGVFACAQFGAWRCEGLEGNLKLEQFYEPEP
ncbi:hypothetical protein SCHPADRAFT_233581 [Schizopora paradoxa]|uniref:Uncharacterized protein n=1 Tax=Schizopora paradoxa TaxID=27342 RepID=A0A0H2RW53_9AGAM|nr:hypothetical protein SCHPADRAFT_233581 [Schizopora paradoxa]